MPSAHPLIPLLLLVPTVPACGDDAPCAGDSSTPACAAEGSASGSTAAASTSDATAPASESTRGSGTADGGSGEASSGSTTDGDTETGDPSVDFDAGSLVIPMDTDFQDAGMLRAYGLVHRLLREGVSVYWVIRAGKTYGDVDFEATSVDVQSGADVGPHGYRGGPFVIAEPEAAAALAIVMEWQADYPETTVHQATEPFTADLGRRPPLRRRAADLDAPDHAGRPAVPQLPVRGALYPRVIAGRYGQGSVPSPGAVSSSTGIVVGLPPSSEARSFTFAPCLAS